MTKVENIKIQKRIGDAVNNGNLDVLKEVVTAGIIDHESASEQDSAIDFFQTMREAFPDLKVTVDKMVADDNNMAIAHIITGTHRGYFMGFPATNRQITAHGVQIARFESGQIVERWSSSDQLGILWQIGVRLTAG